MFSLDEEQFERLLETLGSEPSLSLFSGMFWIGVATILIGLAATFLALYELRRSRAGADSDLILRSFSEYESLYDPLRAVPELAKKNKDLLTYVDGFESYSPEVFEGLGEYAQIDPKEWQQVRKVKTYFKGRFELIGKGFFSDAAIANTMDRAGVNLARRELYQLDKAIFYQVRKEKYDAGLHSDEYLACTFKEDLGWYEALPAFMKKQATSFGWDRP
jgi:hypothetical protein